MLAIEHSSGPQADYAWPRIFNLVLGAWLFLSAFAWQHTAHSRWIAVSIGLSIALVSAWAMFVRAVHWFNALLAIILLVSTVHHTHTALTAWNHAIVAIVVFALALVPRGWQLRRVSPR